MRGRGRRIRLRAVILDGNSPLPLVRPHAARGDERAQGRADDIDNVDAEPSRHGVQVVRVGFRFTVT